MNFLSVAETAKKWNISERSVRNYCALGKIEGAVLNGKTWFIPEHAQKPARINGRAVSQPSLLDILRREKSAKLSGGVYHQLQIDLTYNSNHIEGSRLTHEQTRYIFETNTIGLDRSVVKVDDIIETANHFKCIDIIIDVANRPLSEALIKELHRVLKSGTTDARQDWFAVGEYKRLPNSVGGRETTPPEKVAKQLKALIVSYNDKKTKTFEDLLDFHYRFERIHPFQDGNGRIGRLILFKECLKHHFVPFIIDEEFKIFYYRGLAEWENERGYLTETCLAATDKFKKCLDYFNIKY